MRDTDVQPSALARPTSKPNAPRWTRLALAILIAGLASPGLGDPTSQAGRATACWTPGAAPGLFSWNATPGIACRDNAGSGLPPSGISSDRYLDPLTGTNRVKSDPRTEFSFSGSAYFGIAAVF